MAKIHNPQDQNGIGLINQTVFDEEHALRVAEETRIEGKLDAEVERSIAEDRRLNAAIVAEETRATAAEDTITANLNAEIARASAEESRLNTKVETETNRATGEEAQIRTDLTAVIETEANARIDGDSSLNNRIDEISGNVKISYLDHIPENTVNWCAISVVESHGSEILSGNLIKAIEFKVSNTPSNNCRLGIYNSAENTSKKCLAVSRAVSLIDDKAIFEFEKPFAFDQKLELYILEGGDNFPGNGEPGKPSTYIASPAEEDGEGSTWKNYDKTSQFWGNPRMAFYITYHVIGQIEKVEKNLNTKVDNLSIANEEVKTKISPIYKSFEQKFKSDSSESLNCRGFGNIINKTGFLKSVTTYCPANSNTTESVYLKVFEKTSAPHIFKGISDVLLAHGSNNVLKFTFNENQIELERGKEYFFVFTNESQKTSTEFSNSNTDSRDCCINVTSNSKYTSGGVLGSNGYSRTDRQAIHIIEQEESVTISIENQVESSTELYSNVEESESLNLFKDNCLTAGIQFFAPKSGYLNQLNIGCRDNNSVTSSSEQYAKIWDITAGYGASAVLKGVSTNTQYHFVNANEVFDLKYNFNNVELVEGNKYAITTVEEAYKDDTSIREGLQNNCYRTFSLKNEGIFKAAFINDDATAENTLTHSPIMSMVIISEASKNTVANAISLALVNYSTIEEVEEKLADYQLKSEMPTFPLNYKFTRNKNVELTFGEEDDVLEDTIILTLSEGAKIITANAVSNDNITITQEIGEDAKSISLMISVSKPAESILTHIIVDSICDSESYDNAQHVCHVIPVSIS